MVTSSLVADVGDEIHVSWLQICQKHLNIASSIGNRYQHRSAAKFF